LATAQAPEILVINLDRSPQRWTSMESQLARLGLSATRVPAVDGRGMSPDDFAEFDPAGYAACHGREPVATEIACYMSHLAAMRQFLTSGSDCCVILEDDAVLAPDFAGVIAALARRPDEWDLMLLFGPHSGGPVRLSPLDETHWIVGQTFRQTGSSAYMINRACAERFVRSLVPMRVPYDHAFTLPWKHGLKMRACLPFPVPETLRDTSTIGWNARKKPSLLKRLRVLAYRTRTETRRFLHFLFVDPVIVRSAWARVRGYR